MDKRNKLSYDEFIAVMIERLRRHFPNAHPVYWEHLRDDGTGWDYDIVMDGDYENPISPEDYYIDFVEGDSLGTVYQAFVAYYKAQKERKEI